jgi:hypothetical protein
MKRYPRITGHIIAESLGYARPSLAALIGLDGSYGRENWCEWAYSCYNRNARKILQDSIRNRHTHHGYMAEYKVAKALVDRANATGDEPVLASWF